MGQFPLKALDVLRTVAERFEAIEEGQGGYEGGPGAAATDGRTAVERVALLPELSHSLRDRMSEQICAAAAQMGACRPTASMRLGAKAIIAFTQRGYMASLLSRCRPNCPIFAVTPSQVRPPRYALPGTPSQAVRQHMSVYWGLVPFRLDLSDDAEDNMRRAFAVLKVGGAEGQGRRPSTPPPSLPCTSLPSSLLSATLRLSLSQHHAVSPSQPLPHPSFTTPRVAPAPTRPPPPQARGLVAEGDLIIAVSDVAGGQEAVGARQSVQVRKLHAACCSREGRGGRQPVVQAALTRSTPPEAAVGSRLTA
ncbi:unnamed protein product [Closterium sp. Naga37s-1]|nr:unnamed protein product [Closterium sp. Naga37s-1]